MGKSRNLKKLIWLHLGELYLVVEIRVDYESCTGCKKCVVACSFSVLEWFENQPIVINPSSCSACLECKIACPIDAISIKEK
jgi:MinD superfamily P-loop ATPase